MEALGLQQLTLKHLPEADLPEVAMEAELMQDMFGAWWAGDLL